MNTGTTTVPSPFEVIELSERLLDWRNPVTADPELRRVVGRSRLWANRLAFRVRKHLWMGVADRGRLDFYAAQVEEGRKKELASRSAVGLELSDHPVCTSIFPS